MQAQKMHQNRKARLEFAKKYRGEPVEFWNKVLWTDETKINLYQSDGNVKVWRKEGTVYDPKHTTSSVKHGGGSVMAWACMDASETGSLIFITSVTKGRRRFCFHPCLSGCYLRKSKIFQSQCNG